MSDKILFLNIYSNSLEKRYLTDKVSHLAPLVGSDGSPLCGRMGQPERTHFRKFIYQCYFTVLLHKKIDSIELLVCFHAK